MPSWCTLIHFVIKLCRYDRVVPLPFKMDPPIRTPGAEHHASLHTKRSYAAHGGFQEWHSVVAKPVPHEADYLG